MRDINKILGKKLQSESDIKMFGRFPDSDIEKTLPPGALSPPISSYTAAGWFQLEGSETANWYVKDSDKINVVDPDTDSSASIFDWVGYRAADLWNNTWRENAKTGTRYKEALEESIKDVKISGFEMAKNLRYVLLLVVAIMLLTTLRDLFK